MTIVDSEVSLMESKGLVEFTDRFRRRGSIKVLLKYRREEGLVENGRIREIIGESMGDEEV